MYIDSNGGTHELDLADVEASKGDPLCKYLLLWTSACKDGLF